MQHNPFLIRGSVLRNRRAICTVLRHVCAYILDGISYHLVASASGRRFELSSSTCIHTINVQQLQHLSSQCTDDGIRPAPVNGVFESDIALLDGVGDAVLAALKPLEEVPEEDKDWHPGSNNQDRVPEHEFTRLCALSETLADHLWAMESV